MKHDDYVTIAVPRNVNVTVSEQNQDYSTTFKLNDGTPENTATKTFSIADDSTLLVTNRLEIIIPTGINDNHILFAILGLTAMSALCYIVYRRRKYN